jgi:hypothetical protein
MDDMSFDREFVWWRPKSAPIALDDKLITPSGGELDAYRPLENATLFRVFAALPYNDDAKAAEALVDFANQYGLLWTPMFAPKPEPIEEWRGEIFRMRCALEVNELLRAKTRGLSRFVEVLNKREFRVILPFDETFPLAEITTEGIATGSVLRFGLPPEARNIIESSRKMLGYAVASTLGRAMRRYPSRVRPHWNNGEFGLSVVPTSLLAALWYQASAAITGGAMLMRQCEICREWIEGSRKGQRYCSNKCRQEAFRRAKQ